MASIIEAIRNTCKGIAPLVSEKLAYKIPKKTHSLNEFLIETENKWAYPIRLQIIVRERAVRGASPRCEYLLLHESDTPLGMKILYEEPFGDKSAGEDNSISENNPDIINGWILAWQRLHLIKEIAPDQECFSIQVGAGISDWNMRKRIIDKAVKKMLDASIKQI